MAGDQQKNAVVPPWEVVDPRDAADESTGTTNGTTKRRAARAPKAVVVGVDSSKPDSTVVGYAWDDINLDFFLRILFLTFLHPFFAIFVPILVLATGTNWRSSHAQSSMLYAGLVCAGWMLSWLNRIWRNGWSLIYQGPMADWGEEVVVITGGASGIGALVAETLALKNVAVAVLDVKPSSSENYNITYYQCDVSDRSQVEAATAKIREELGAPTMLINNAGIVHCKLLLELTPEEINSTINVNLVSHYWTLQAFLPDMIKNNHGHIVTLGSVMGYVGASRTADYSATKGALLTLHETLRYELDKKYKAPNVRTTLVLPSHVTTTLFKGVEFPPLARFLMPSLPPLVVAKEIIAALDMQESRTIRVPFFVHLAPWLRCMPTYVRDLAQYLSGADEALTNVAAAKKVE